jgi:hypothetical protein
MAASEFRHAKEQVVCDVSAGGDESVGLKLYEQLS